MRLRLVHPAGALPISGSLLEAIAHEAAGHGIDARVVESFEPADDVVHVVLPRYFSVIPVSAWPSEEVLSRTIALLTDPLGAGAYDDAVGQSLRCGRRLDVSRASVTELQRRGVAVGHFQVGYTDVWDRWRGGEQPRPTDLLHVGQTDLRRVEMLCRAIPIWSDRQVALHLADDKPVTDPQVYLLGEAKLETLAGTKVLPTWHRHGSRTFPWVMAVEAICNGAVVVTEHSIDPAPLRPGEHFVSVAAEHVGLVARSLVDDADALTTIRRAAYEQLRSVAMMTDSVADLLTLADEMVTHPPAVFARDDIPLVAQPPTPLPWQRPVTDLDLVGAGVRRLEHRLRDVERAVTRIARRLEGTSDEAVAWRTPAFELARPRVSVIVPLFNHAAEVAEALGTVEASAGVDYEVLIQDDASTDRSVDAVRAFIDERPWFPAEFVCAPVNQGLPATRNDLWRRGRGEYVFALDSDNGVHPRALERLARALDEQPEAAFAYAPTLLVRAGTPTWITSFLPWQPRRLRYGNFIDAMSMLRRSTLERFGGWSLSMQDGWEDFHLWARIGEAGLPAALVPEPLCWYRLMHGSMLTASDMDQLSLWARIRADAPTLMAD